MPNRLIHETSPYLLQHANNPVDWYPWGPEALERAAREDRPILLSVGYSACHWCHVMERESFERPATAALMNAGFVCVKVDREERPDLDEIYMKAVQAFTGGHGGWPMTVFLTPDGRPYFGGTYFPPEPKGGMPGFPQVLAHAARLYKERGPQLQKVTEDLLEWIRSSARIPRNDGGLGEGWLEAVAESCAEDFDARNGGFGRAPKFPPYGQLAALLALHHRSGERRPLRLALETLDQMAKGGMYDLLGGGFARYSVDEAWRVPHFEKMLYDNAQMLPLYTEAWRITGAERYRRIVTDTIGYVSREMTHPDGAFYASQDADSEGEEGRFFAWTPRELREVLGFLDGLRAATLLQVTEEGTFEHGKSVLRLETPVEDLSAEDQALLGRALPKLFAARANRVAPGRDDKIVSSWNGLMISAFARAGAAFGQPAWVESAARAARFLLDHMTINGRLRRTWKDGKAPLLAYLDDYAALLAGLVDLYEASFDLGWLREAVALADRMIDLFWDEADGAFFYTGHDAESLITRSKHLVGGAEPSGNGLAAAALLRLSALTDRADYGDKAERVLLAYRPYLDRAPRALGYEAVAAAWRIGPTMEVGLVGAPDSADTAALITELRRHYLPFAVAACVSPGQDTALLPWMAGREAYGGAATAFVCVNHSCQLPVQQAQELAAQLRAPVAGAPKATRDHAPALPADPAAWLNAPAPYTLDRLAGNVVVLDFWTYCCINCMHVLPELAAIEERFAGQPVAVIGVHSAKFTAERERDNVAAALRRHHVVHPVVLDPRHRLWQEYAVHAWPTVLVLDPLGRIAWRSSGEVDREQLAGIVQDLLDEGRERGTLSAPAWTRPAPAPEAGALAFPGKISVWPAALDQAMGADAFALGSRVYLSDSGHHQIVEASLSRGEDGWPVANVLRRFGSGQPGLVDGPAETASFRGPQGVVRHGRTLWVADTENHAIRTVDLETGAVATIGGTGELGRGRPADPRHARGMPLRSPWDVAVHAEGPDAPPAAVLIAMAGAHQIWVYLPNRDHLGPFVGSGREDHVDGTPDEAALAQPSGLSLFGRYLFIADSEVSSVRVVDLGEHTVGTVVGEGLFDFGDVDGSGDQVRLQHPLGVAAMGDQLYVADTFNHKIKFIDLQNGEVATLAGGKREQLSEPCGLAIAGNFVLVADTNNHRIRAVNRKTGELRDVPLR